ncbi:hypothetical protein B4U84_25500 [Westiellopsis prolifica IICB1]|nr:hypothetical protein B4U84_25500 [Westiellopsis prolifica IICB1]
MGIGHWAWGIGHWALGTDLLNNSSHTPLSPHTPHTPHTPLSPFPFPRSLPFLNRRVRNVVLTVIYLSGAEYPVFCQLFFPMC